MHDAPAYYARHGGPLADWWTVLHPPYTLWHLSYVVLGAAMAPTLDWWALALSVVAFFLAVGIAAHALDESAGRPLGTGITDRSLTAVAVLALVGAVLVGLYGALVHQSGNWPVLASIPVGAVLVVGYNLELWGGRLHNDLTFALAWGGFPVVVGYLAQAPAPSLRGVAAAAVATTGGVAMTYAQRFLSTPARYLRRDTRDIFGSAIALDGQLLNLNRHVLLAPIERTLRALSWAVPLLAVAALLA